MKEDVLEVEAPLIEEQMDTIDKQLQKAVSEVNWTTNGLCIKNITCTVLHLHNVHVHLGPMTSCTILHVQYTKLHYVQCTYVHVIICIIILP